MNFSKITQRVTDEEGIAKYRLQERVPFALFSAIIMIILSLIYIRTGAAFALKEGGKVFTDFDAFYTAGKLYWSGDMVGAYDPEYFMKAQEDDAQFKIFMPWTYPPPYNLVVAGLATMPRGFSYAFFMSVSAILFLVAVFKVSRELLIIPLVLVFPAIVMTVIGGQNSFLTATFVAVFCLALTTRASVRMAGGFPLGLMVIKPHLALGFGWMLLLQRRWIVILGAAGTAGVIIAISVMVFGQDVWWSFFSALAYSKGYLQEGLYPMDRMTSVYALIFTLTKESYFTALVVHQFIALTALVAVWYAISRSWSLVNTLSVSCVTTLFISPYNYDYDLVILAVALALSARDLGIFSSLLEKALFLLMFWLATGWGAISTFLIRDLGPSDAPVYSLGGLGLIGASILYFKVLREAELHRQVDCEPRNRSVS